MESPTQIAERAKTSTESDARARVTWSQLQELAGAYVTAKKNLLSRPQRPLGDLNVNADMEETRLMDEFNAAERVYHAAMKKYQEQGK